MLLFFSVRHYIICIVLCYMCVPANGQNNCLDSFDMIKLEASLGSTVLLECSFEDTWLGNSSVLWSNPLGSRLVNITAKGMTDFKDPRDGRVKVFPNQGSKGNYSIRIDVLQDSDFGLYGCELGDECRKVKLTKAEEDNKEGAWKDYIELFYISTGAVLFILLFSTCYFFNRIFTRHCKKSQPDYENGDFHTVSTASTLPLGVSACGENLGHGKVGNANGGIIYENNEHDPAINQQHITRNVPISQNNPSTTESQRRLRVTFHRELLNRLRQASLRRHFYVNQPELSQHARSPVGNGQRASFWRKRATQKCEYENPIYNNSTDQLNL